MQNSKIFEQNHVIPFGDATLKKFNELRVF